MLAEIECGIVRFPFVLERNALPLGRDSRDVFLVEVIRSFEKRMLEFSLGLADQMIDLGRGHATDLEFDCAQRPGADRQLLFAIEREHAALAFNLNLARQRRHIDDRVVIFTERIIARRADAFLYSDVKLAVSFDANTKRMLSILGFL